MFLYLLGTSQAGVVFMAFLRLVESDWGKPWYRLAELSTLAYFPFAMIAIVVVMRRADGGGHFGPYQIRSLGVLVTCFTLLWLYFFWAQFFVIWFGNLPQESKPVWPRMYGHYSPFFWVMIAGFLATVMILARRLPVYSSWEMSREA